MCKDSRHGRASMTTNLTSCPLNGCSAIRHSSELIAASCVMGPDCRKTLTSPYSGSITPVTSATGTHRTIQIGHRPIAPLSRGPARGVYDSVWIVTAAELLQHGVTGLFAAG